jgi:hypothetical protein
LLSLIQLLIDNHGNMNFKIYISCTQLSLNALGFAVTTQTKPILAFKLRIRCLGIKVCIAEDDRSFGTVELWLKKIQNDLSLAGFSVNLTWDNHTTVHKAWIKGSGLLL